MIEAAPMRRQIREVGAVLSDARHRAIADACCRRLRRGLGRARRLGMSCLCLILVVPVSPAAADPPHAAAATVRTRGVRLLDPGEVMTPIAPYLEVTPGSLGRIPASLDKIRVAVAEGRSAELDGLDQRAAAFEVVPVTAGPDLVWNARSGTASVAGRIVAFAVDRESLPAVIDRTAVVRGLEKQAAARPQQIGLGSGRTAARKGERIEIEVDGVAERALVLFVIAGDGTVQFLYPRGADPRVVSSRTFRWSLQIGEPLGTDLIVAVTAPQQMPALEEGLARLGGHRSAGEILKLLALAAAPDAKIGLFVLSTMP